MAKGHKHKAMTIKLIILTVVLLITLLGVIIDKNISSKIGPFYIEETKNINKEDAHDISHTSHQILIGTKKAPVEMIAYIDYQSPYSKKFYKKTYLELKSRYIDNGTLKVIIKDFPNITQHKKSLELSQIVHCTYEQEKSPLGYEIVLSERKTDIEDTKYTLELLGIEESKLNNCINSGKYENDILRNLQIAQEKEITQTPTFLIEGELIEGPKPFRVFEEIIERKLNETSS